MKFLQIEADTLYFDKISEKKIYLPTEGGKKQREREKKKRRSDEQFKKMVCVQQQTNKQTIQKKKYCLFVQTVRTGGGGAGERGVTLLTQKGKDDFIFCAQAVCGGC